MPLYKHTHTYIHTYIDKLFDEAVNIPFRLFSYIFTSKGSFTFNSQLKRFAVSALRIQKGESVLPSVKAINAAI